MGNAPKHPSPRDDLKRWDDEGGAPRAGHPSHEPHPPAMHEAEPALYYFNVWTASGVIEDPEGDMHPSLQAAREAARAQARALIAEGEQTGEDRRSWRVEVMDRANHQVLTVAFSEVFDSGAPS